MSLFLKYGKVYYRVAEIFVVGHKTEVLETYGVQLFDIILVLSTKNED